MASQRKQQSKKVLVTQLREIPGVGEKTAQKLLTVFGSISGVEEADEPALAEVVGPALAGRIRSDFAHRRQTAAADRGFN